MKKIALSRRTLLRGVGASLALPWLEAMTPAARGAENSAPPKRLACLFMPNGTHAGMWTPDGKGRDFRFSRTLEPLSALRDEIMVLTNLWNAGSDFGDGHYVKTSGFLTCTTIQKSLGIDLNCHGTSLDQVVARKVGTQTPIPSLELAIQPTSIGVDGNVGYTRVYGSHIAWRGPTQPLAREINPRLVFERLFRATHPQADDAGRDLHLLDRVVEDANQLRTRLGVDDRRRMEEYLDSVRALEVRLEHASRGNPDWKPRAEFDETDKPAGIPESHAEHVRLMLDLMALAFQTDATRVCTFMFGNAVSNTSFSFLQGVDGGHHSLSHHQDEAEKLRQYQLIGRWHVAQYAYLLNQLGMMQEGDGTVLDNSVILFGSGLRDGNRHSPHNLPILVGGRAGGRLATGQHLLYGRDTPLSNLYLAILDALDCPQQRFADSTERLPGVLV